MNLLPVRKHKTYFERKFRVCKNSLAIESKKYDDCEFSLTKQFEAIFFFAQHKTKNDLTSTS